MTSFLEKGKYYYYLAEDKYFLHKKSQKRVSKEEFEAEAGSFFLEDEKMIDLGFQLDDLSEPNQDDLPSLKKKLLDIVSLIDTIEKRKIEREKEYKKFIEQYEEKVDTYKIPFRVDTIITYDENDNEIEISNDLAYRNNKNEGVEYELSYTSDIEIDALLSEGGNFIEITDEEEIKKAKEEIDAWQKHLEDMADAYEANYEF